MTETKKPGNAPDAQQPAGPEPAKPKGLAVGAFLLPACVFAGAVAGAELARVHGNWSTAGCWLGGAPLGALAGLVVGFVLLVVLNSVLRIFRKR